MKTELPPAWLKIQGINICLVDTFCDSQPSEGWNCILPFSLAYFLFSVPESFLKVFHLLCARDEGLGHPAGPVPDIPYKDGKSVPGSIDILYWQGPPGIV